MTLRLLRRLLSADLLGLLLVLFSLETFTYGISASVRGTNMGYLLGVCLIAALFGFVLSSGKVSGPSSAIFMTVVGIIGVWILGARLAYPLLALFKSIVDLVPQIIPSIREHTVIDTHLVSETWTAIVQASAALAMRWQSWSLGIDRNVTVNDALIRSMIWTLFMWLVAAWTGWFAAKRNAVPALLPQILLLAAVISYSEYKVETFWLMVFILLLLLGVWNFKNHTTQWERHKVDYSDSIRYDNTQAVLFLAISIGIIAFVTPSISWRQIRDFLRERRDANQTAEMLGVQEQKVAARNVAIQKPSLPREHLLTESFAQSQEIVMTIRTGELPPVPSASFATEAPRYYWRSTIYDGYVGAGWVTTSAPAQSYKANTPLIQGLLSGYRPLHLDVDVFQPEGRLFWSGLLYSADVPFRADWRIRPGSELFADQTALLEADMFAAATSATAYQADVYIPAVTLDELRGASTEYPPNIQEHYLDLPNEVPERVHQLARQITKEIDNPYDKAKAIESYLRTNYPYDLEVPPPPEDKDVADYFLFDLKKGYCDYYATAMVVLARSSGLPARFVSGYSPGSYDALNAQYVVRKLNAHSWPEVYFPEIGWIEFEPTGSEPEIEHPEKATEALTPDEPVTPVSRFLFQLTSERVLVWLSPIAAALLFLILYYAFIDQIIFLRLAPTRAIELLYRRVYRLGRPLAGKSIRAETAHEFADGLIRTVNSITDRSKSNKALFGVQNDVRQLTDLYYASLFSTHITHKTDVRIAFSTWKRLRRSLFIAKILRWILNRNEQARRLY